jgi:mannosyltransferase
MTARVAGSSFGSMWDAARATEQPHFVYYVLMKGWFAIVGSNHWLDRFPSVVFMAGAVITLTVLGTRLFGRTAGLVAGLTLATNFWLLHWAQFARSLTLSLLLATFATYAFVRALEAPSSRLWAWTWAISVITASWINLFAVCVVAGHAAAYLVQTRRNPDARRHRRLDALLGLLVCVTVLPNVVLVASADNGQLDWIPQVSLGRLVSQPWVWAGRNSFALAAGFLGLAAMVAGTMPAAARWRTALVGQRRVAPWKLVLLVGWVAAPFVVTLLLSAIRPAFDAHYLFSAAPALALLVGAAVAYLPKRLSLAVLTLVAINAGIYLAVFYAARPYGTLSSLF